MASRIACRQGRILYKSEVRVDGDRGGGEVLDKQAATPSDAGLRLHKRSEGTERSERPMRYEM